MNQKVAVGVVFVAAMFMSIMDVTIVNVALPTIGHTFKVPATSVDAVSIGFLVSLAVFIPASGWLGDRFGGRRVLLSAIVVFTGASALCGLSTSLGMLVAFRILQGVGGGMLAPVGMAMLFRAFPPHERIRASAILTLPTTLAPALGPVLGGLLVTDLSWRGVFFVNLPIGAATLIFGLLFLEGAPQERPGAFDVWGFLLSGAGLGLLMYGISEGPIKGWGDRLIVGSIGLGLALLATLVAVELRRREPLVDLRLLKNRLFRSSNAVMILGSAAFLGTLYVVTLFFQDGRGLSPLAAGLSTFPEAIGVMAGAQVASRLLYPLLGPRRHIALGLSGVAGSIAAMSLIGSGTNLWWMRALMLSMGFFMGQVFVPVQAVAFATITPAATGRASTMFNALRQLGGAVGVAVFTTVIVAVGASQRTPSGSVVPHLAAYHAAFLVAAGLGLLAIPAALRISDREAVATMPSGRRRRALDAAESGAERAPVAGGPVPRPEPVGVGVEA